jgi:hypothetical protein
MGSSLPAGCHIPIRFSLSERRWFLRQLRFSLNLFHHECGGSPATNTTPATRAFSRTLDDGPGSPGLVQ